MEWNAAQYGPGVAAILEMAGGGRQPMPLVSPRSRDEALAVRLRRPTGELFPDAAKPQAAHAGLWLYCGFFDESHEIAQDIHSAEGSFWHGILHRMEPDAWNAGYWFRRVGEHAVFEPLRDVAAALGYKAGSRWDPLAFIAACDKATEDQRIQLEQVQLAEWHLLFHHCAKAE